MPGWAGSNRRAELPPNWETEIRPAVLWRDHYQCQHTRFDTGAMCGRYANQVDHVADRDSYRLEDLQALCKYHHDQKSGAEGGRASQEARRRRNPKSGPKLHPGLLG